MWRTFILLCLPLPLLLLFFAYKHLLKRYEIRNFDLTAPVDGRTLTCSQPQELFISQPFAERARLKARLYNLLRESLYDDSKGVVNIAREKEIKHLASKLKDDRMRLAGRGASLDS